MCAEGDVEKHGSGQSSEYYTYNPPQLQDGQNIVRWQAIHGTVS
jgi:hypothetical protein